MQCLTLILMGDKFAKRRAWFFNSISLMTDGGSLLILLLSQLLSVVIASIALMHFLTMIVLSKFLQNT